MRKKSKYLKIKKSTRGFIFKLLIFLQNRQNENVWKNSKSLNIDLSFIYYKSFK